jgi:hypothetical protein
MDTPSAGPHRISRCSFFLGITTAGRRLTILGFLGGSNARLTPLVTVGRKCTFQSAYGEAAIRRRSDEGECLIYLSSRPGRKFVPVGRRRAFEHACVLKQAVVGSIPAGHDKQTRLRRNLRDWPFAFRATVVAPSGCP